MARKVRDQVVRRIKEVAFGNGKRDDELEQIAWLIVHHPKKRAAYFADPEKSLKDAKKINGEGNQRRLALLIELLINEDPRLVSAKEAFFERESFLKQAMQNPETSFLAVFRMSIATFAAGVLLLVGAALAAIFFEDPTLKGVISGLAGGGGVVTTLVAALRASSKEIRTMNNENAKIRLILTDFATEITHVRAIPVITFGDAKEQNAELRRLTKDAVSLLPSDSPPAAGKDEVETAEADAKDRAVESLDQGSSKADGGKDQKPSKIDADEEDKNNKKT